MLSERVIGCRARAQGGQYHVGKSSCISGETKVMKLISQDVAEGRFRPTLKPEERLLLAVVESAYWDLQNPDPARRRTARAYFLDEEDHHTFSFVSICQ